MRRKAEYQPTGSNVQKQTDNKKQQDIQKELRDNDSVFEFDSNTQKQSDNDSLKKL